MASADLMGGQQLGAESLDASDAENAPPRSSSCPPARGRQTSAVQPGQAQQARATPVSRESSGLLRASHRVSGQSPGTPRLSRHVSPLPASVAGSGEVGDNLESSETFQIGGSGFESSCRVPLGNIQLPQSQRDFSTRYPHPIPPQRARSGSSGAPAEVSDNLRSIAGVSSQVSAGGEQPPRQALTDSGVPPPITTAQREPSEAPRRRDPPPPPPAPAVEATSPPPDSVQAAAGAAAAAAAAAPPPGMPPRMPPPIDLGVPITPVASAPATTAGSDALASLLGLIEAERAERAAERAEQRRRDELREEENRREREAIALEARRAAERAEGLQAQMYEHRRREVEIDFHREERRAEERRTAVYLPCIGLRSRYGADTEPDT